MIPNKKTARLAGLLFLLTMVFGLFAEIFFRQKLFVADDAAATAVNILSNVFLYRAGILSDILMSLFYLLTALALYKLLVSVNKHLAQTMVLFAAAGSVLLLGNILNELAPLTLLSAGGQPGAFTDGQLQAMAMFNFNAYNHGYMLGQVFFALWVLPLGVLIFRSNFIPRALGILFVIETICGLLAVTVHFLVPNASIETILLIPCTIAEFAFVGWLLIRGINESRLTVQNA
jgi:hypothetical protein